MKRGGLKIEDKQRTLKYYFISSFSFAFPFLPFVYTSSDLLCAFVWHAWTINGVNVEGQAC
jgi:hypothetical protein